MKRSEIIKYVIADSTVERHMMDNITGSKNFTDCEYLSLLYDIINNGNVKQDRTGTGTISVFGRQVRFDMKEGFPLLTSKKVSSKNVLIELFWFLGKHMKSEYYRQFGLTNAKYLVDNNCMIWCGDLFKAYQNDLNNVIARGDYESVYRYNPSWFKPSLTDGLPLLLEYDYFIDKLKSSDDFCKRWGNLGKVYGHQWNRFGEYEGNTDDFFEGTDQIAKLIKQLRDNPDSRRIMLNAWNPNDLHDMVLPPCHYGFQLYTRELSYQERFELASHHVYAGGGMIREGLSGSLFYKGEEQDMKTFDEHNIPKRAISLMWNQRSVDTPLGLPYNIASYGFLLHMFAKVVNMVPEELVGNLGDTHIYLDQLDGVKKQLSNETFRLPTLQIGGWGQEEKFKTMTDFDLEDFRLFDYKNAGTVKYPLSN